MMSQEDQNQTANESDCIMLTESSSSSSSSSNVDFSDAESSTRNALSDGTKGKSTALVRPKIYRVKNVEWSCQQCNIYCNSRQQFEAHMLSQKHENELMRGFELAPSDNNGNSTMISSSTTTTNSSEACNHNGQDESSIVTTTKEEENNSSNSNKANNNNDDDSDDSAANLDESLIEEIKRTDSVDSEQRQREKSLRLKSPISKS